MHKILFADADADAGNAYCRVSTICKNVQRSMLESQIPMITISGHVRYWYCMDYKNIPETLRMFLSGINHALGLQY